MTRALVTGVTGQDGSYLAEHLAAEGVEVFGLIRRPDHPRREWIERLVPGIRPVVGDLLDPVSLARILREVRPDEVYNLAALTSPGGRGTAEAPPLLTEVTGTAVVHLLDLVRIIGDDVRLVHASSSAIYDPRRYGTYGVAKRLAHDTVEGYRELGGVLASNAIFFSHTSPRQSDRFLVRRLVRSVVAFSRHRPVDLRVTNLANRRDWGWAPDFVTALPVIARGAPGDLQVRTGETHSVADVIEATCAELGTSSDEVIGTLWPDADRTPSEEELIGDEYGEDHPRVFGWRHSTTFDKMIEKLVEVEVNSP